MQIYFVVLITTSFGGKASSCYKRNSIKKRVPAEIKERTEFMQTLKQVSARVVEKCWNVNFIYVVYSHLRLPICYI